MDQQKKVMLVFPEYFYGTMKGENDAMIRKLSLKSSLKKEGYQVVDFRNVGYIPPNIPKEHVPSIESGALHNLSVDLDVLSRCHTLALSYEATHINFPYYQTLIRVAREYAINVIHETVDREWLPLAEEAGVHS
jgi:hypothetical protein